MQIKLYKTTDGNNILDKTLTDEKTISNVDIVEPCNVLAPAFILRYDSNALNYNYCNAFGRYYFITGLQVLTGGRCVISCAVDVLYTYRDGIKNSVGTFLRSENPKQNYLPDNKLPVTTQRKFLSWLYPQTPFTAANGWNYLLTTVGGANSGNN